MKRLGIDVGPSISDGDGKWTSLKDDLCKSVMDNIEEMRKNGGIDPYNISSKMSSSYMSDIDHLANNIFYKLKSKLLSISHI